MNKIEFEQVQAQYRTSGKSLKNFLKEIRVSYTTYNYWRKKLDAGKRDHPMVPITIREPQGSNAENTLAGVGLPGVMPVFPNGVKAHIGRGSEWVLMEVLKRSLD